jgi:hypothetical protein
MENAHWHLSRQPEPARSARFASPQQWVVMRARVAIVGGDQLLDPTIIGPAGNEVTMKKICN